MKNKKALGIITAAGACALLVFSVFVFPLILAASPENKELETIETNNAYPPEENREQDETPQLPEPEKTDQPDDEDVKPDINAISKETAISKVLSNIAYGEHTYVSPIGEVSNTSLELRSARYIEGVDHIDAPIWRVLFYERHFGESFVYIPVNPNPEEAQSIENRIEDIKRLGDLCCFDSFISEDKSGLPVIITSFDYKSLYFIDVNAFTGELIGQGLVGLCDHEGTKREFSYDETTDWEMLIKSEDIYYHTLNDIKELNHPKTEAPPHPTPEPSPRPVR